MRHSARFVFSFAILLAASPAFAGNLTFDNGQTDWHSTQCTRPTAPPEIVKAKSDSSGEDMNVLVGQYNAYVSEAQAYMNCVSNEADHDQTAVDQSITASAQKAIAGMQSEVDSYAPRPNR